MMIIVGYNKKMLSAHAVAKRKHGGYEAMMLSPGYTEAITFFFGNEVGGIGWNLIVMRAVMNVRLILYSYRIPPSGPWQCLKN